VNLVWSIYDMPYFRLVQCFTSKPSSSCLADNLRCNLENSNHRLTNPSTFHHDITSTMFNPLDLIISTFRNGYKKGYHIYVVTCKPRRLEHKCIMQISSSHHLFPFFFMPCGTGAACPKSLICWNNRVREGKPASHRAHLNLRSSSWSTTTTF